MNWLIFREPVSTWTHGLWMMGALPASVLLWRVCRGDRVKQLGLLIFGVCLFLCYGGSALYHGVRLQPTQIEWCRTIDHIGIFLLIAGTATPPALVFLRGRLRLASLLVAWTLAACGIGLQLSWSAVPAWLDTLIYVALGWGVFVGYFEVAHLLPPGATRPIWIGGLFYTVGAIINLIEWPSLVPGAFGSHELWHLFAMAGSFCHFWFMVRWVASFDRRCALPVRSLAAGVAASSLPRVVSPMQVSAPTS